LPRGMQRV